MAEIVWHRRETRRQTEKTNFGLPVGLVRFRYRDYTHGNKTRILGREPEEFIRRFRLHILPKPFVRIRGYGLLANRDRRKHLQKARDALGTIDLLPLICDSWSHANQS